MSPPSVPVTIGVVVGTSMAANVVKGTWKPERGARILIGGFLVGVALYALTAVDANLGATFGWFVILVAMLRNGIPALSHIVK